MRRTSGPITVEIREGMVTVARHVYYDTRCALTDDWPKWVEETLERVEQSWQDQNTKKAEQ